MAGTLFIRLHGERVSWRVDEAGGASGESDLQQAAEHARGRRVVLLVSVADCPLFHVKLPTRNRARMIQAIPYALEDQLSEDVEDLHFAAGKPDADGGVDVAVVAHAKMKEWLARLLEVGIRPQRIVPDVLALPVQAGTWSALLEPDNMLLRQGPQQGMALDTANLSFVLPLVLEEAGETLPDWLHVINCDLDRDNRAVLPPLEIKLESEECGGTSLHHLINGYDNSRVIDLLQDSYSPSEQASKLWRRWRIVAILGVVLLAASLFRTALENNRLAAEESTLRQRITEVYRQTFPQDQHIVDPRIQMEKHLIALQQGGDRSGGVFLTLVAKAATPLTVNRSVKLGTVRFKDGRLDLEMELPSLQVLDQLKAKLEALGLEVKIRNARSREGKVEGRLEIREARS